MTARPRSRFRDPQLIGVQLIAWIATIIFFYFLYLFLYPNLKLVSPGGVTPTSTGGITSSHYQVFASIPVRLNDLARLLISFYTSSTGVALFYIIVLAAAFLNEMAYIPLAYYHARLDKIRHRREGLISEYPLVSVIVPARNEEKTIETTIRTLHESDYPNLEIVVVNDGSSDGTRDVVEPYAQRRQVLLVNRPQAGGKAMAFNTGLAVAGGDIVIIIDADVALACDAIRRLLVHFEDAWVGSASGNVKVGNRVNLLTRLQALEYIRDLSIRRRALELLHSITVVPGACGAFRKSALNRTGTMDRDTVVEDMDATIRLVKARGDIRYEPHSLAFTEAPETFAAWVRQRKRWYGGGWQTLSKHRESWWKFGPLSAFGYPSLVLSMLFTPTVELITVSMLFLYLYGGLWYGALIAFTVIMLIEFFMDAFAIGIDHEDWRLLLYVPIYVVAYRIMVDVVRMQGYFLAATGRLGWYRTGRYGGLLERMQKA